jgi:hypothetical protein
VQRANQREVIQLNKRDELIKRDDLFFFSLSIHPAMYWLLN